MKRKITLYEFVDQIAKQTGLTKKLTEEFIHVLPEIIEDGLKRDGEVKVPGLGTFSLKWIKAKAGWNLKTGERVVVAPHNKIAFHPENQLKDYVNEDFKYLTFNVIKEKTEPPVVSEPSFQEAIPEPIPGPVPSPEPVRIAEPEVKVEEPEPVKVAEPEPLKVAGSEPVKSENALYSEPEQVIIKTPNKAPASLPERRRSNLYWIIPLTILVILVLLVVFYLRACRQQGEQVVQQTPPSTEQVAAPQATDSLSSAQAVTPKTETVTTTPPEQKVSEPEPQKQSLPTGYTTPTGTHLFQIAREIYGNEYLWVLIYKANQDKISDPDQLVEGSTLVIPPLEGTPNNLTRNDSLEISEGYRLLYDYYNANQNPAAENFRRAVNVYKPK